MRHKRYRAWIIFRRLLLKFRPVLLWQREGAVMRYHRAVRRPVLLLRCQHDTKSRAGLKA